jgi:hypothetical protein
LSLRKGKLEYRLVELLQLLPENPFGFHSLQRGFLRRVLAAFLSSSALRQTPPAASVASLPFALTRALLAASHALSFLPRPSVQVFFLACVD